MNPISDQGLASGRTALAWQRTALSLVAGAAIMSRLTFERAGIGVLVPLAAALLGAWVLVESRARYRHSSGAHPRRHGRGGRAALWLALATAAIAVAELMSVS